MVTIDQERWRRVRDQMERAEVDHLLAGPSADLLYLTGLRLSPSERLVLLVFPQQGEPRLILPGFLLPRIKSEGLADILDPLPWEEADDPVELLASTLPRRGAGSTLAISGHLYAAFLLRIQAAILPARYVDGGLVMDPVRMIKGEAEVLRLREAAAATDTAFKSLIESPLAGLTEREILERFQQLARAEGIDRADRGVVAIGSNAASSYHRMGERRAKPGEAVLIDIGAERGGYHFELTRTIHFGPAHAEFQHVYHLVREANQRAFEHIRPGVTAEDVDAAARKTLHAAGLGDFFLHRTGHGIGLDPHEPPYIVARNKTPLEKGMTFSIEPGVYLPGKFGVRIEDIVLVTSQGVVRLTGTTHDLITVEA